MNRLLTPAEFVARLTAVNWSGTGSLRRITSRKALMREHLRRMAWWAEELSSDEWPFPDLTAGIDPAVRPAPELVAQLKAIPAIPGTVTQDVCLKALRWYTLQEQDPSPSHLPDPYEPLLWFLERGGEFTIISGYIDIDGGLVPRGDTQSYRTSDPQVALDAKALDQLDGLSQA